MQFRKQTPSPSAGVQAKARQKQSDVRIKADLAAPQANSAAPLACKIMYCSRTHSQLQQVVRELEKTAYSRVKCATAFA
jgi:hypothetical protein